MQQKVFELLGGSLCLDFLNTIHEYGAKDPREELQSYQDLIAFSLQTGAISPSESSRLTRAAVAHPETANRVLGLVREFRLSLYRIFSEIADGKLPSSRDLEVLNQQLAHIMPNLRIQTKNNDVEWSWERKGGNLERPLWPIVRSAAELLTSEDRKLVRECDSQTCTWLFLDHSKNGTRRWCDMKRCGNRAKWHRHYEKIKKKHSK
jgi:predicted RNA-binding Zn ribbon-like protein